MDHFEGRVAVVTGAGSGLGRALARHAARLRMKVVLADVQADALQAVAYELAEMGADAVTHRTDVSVAGDVETLARRSIDAFGRVNLLFNNAGVMTTGPVWEQSESDWRWMLGVNLWGVIHGIRAFVPLLLKQGTEAHIVNTASVAGLVSPAGLGAYAVSKHAVVALSETLHHDLRQARADVSVSVLCPAFVPTGLAASERNRPSTLAAAEPTASQRAAQDAVHKAIESGRLSADDVAQLTFDAVRSRRFYVLTHPRIVEAVRLRCEDIALLREPTDAASRRPESGAAAPTAMAQG